MDWLPWAEYCYDSSYHSSLKATPFKVVYGWDPTSLLDYTPGEAQVAAVETILSDHDAFLKEVRDRLLQAQQYAKKHYDAHHRALEFEVGEWVWLRLHHRPALSVPGHVRGKLVPRFYGPYQILARIGSVAYSLQLPEGARLHDFFHISMLKKFQGSPRLQCCLHCRPLRTAGLSLSLSVSWMLAYAVTNVNSLCNGSGHVKRMLPRYLLQISSNSGHNSSSRMSFLPRRGEMLRGVFTTSAGSPLPWFWQVRIWCYVF